MTAFLLVGSFRGPKSASDALGSYLLESLEAKGINTGKIYVHQALSSEQGIKNLYKAVEEADIIILSAPLFADSLPAPVIKAMELVREDITKRCDKKPRSMVAISNSGFPEARHNEISLAISRRFALACGFEWAGGLALGGGGAISGKRLEHVRGIAKNIRKSLDLAAEALSEGRPLPPEAIRLISRPLMPKCLYVWMAETGEKHVIKRNGAWEKIYDRPYRGR
jgi:NADPH-dependent FMN reductase